LKKSIENDDWENVNATLQQGGELHNVLD